MALAVSLLILVRTTRPSSHHSFLLLAQFCRDVGGTPRQLTFGEGACVLALVHEAGRVFQGSVMLGVLPWRPGVEKRRQDKSIFTANVREGNM